MTLPLPILVIFAYPIGFLIQTVAGILNLVVYSLTKDSILPRQRLIDPGDPAEWRVVRKFLFLPLIRLDDQGWDWLDYRPVYQRQEWRGGSEGGMVWVDQWVTAPDGKS